MNLYLINNKSILRRLIINSNNLIKKWEKSPFYKLLNITVLEAKNDFARLKMNIEEKHLQFFKKVHGGAIASLADSAAGWAVFGSTGKNYFISTIEMKINYFTPVESGELIAEAKVVHKGNKIIVSDVEINNNEQIVAKGLITFYAKKK